jgi:AraC family transcriptional regulator of adaptative response / DNA-3-methyladenine glycosylase II
MQEVQGFERRALDEARHSRDARFDGRFFIAVKTTGIYCRPICPAPRCKSRNVRYYPRRPPRLRPVSGHACDAAPNRPGTPAWIGTSAVVRRALRLIHETAPSATRASRTPALRVGVGSRHLHRLFLQHVGASPIAVAQTRRLHFAKRLIDETGCR